jgi:ABC-2 type transport system permease protein
MKSILLREIKSFWFANRLLSYRIFLIINGLFLWVFEGDYNILNTGFADMSHFFTLALGF